MGFLQQWVEFWFGSSLSHLCLINPSDGCLRPGVCLNNQISISPTCTWNSTERTHPLTCLPTLHLLRCQFLKFSFLSLPSIFPLDHLPQNSSPFLSPTLPCEWTLKAFELLSEITFWVQTKHGSNTYSGESRAQSFKTTLPTRYWSTFNNIDIDWVGHNSNSFFFRQGLHTA